MTPVQHREHVWACWAAAAKGPFPARAVPLPTIHPAQAREIPRQLLYPHGCAGSEGSPWYNTGKDWASLKSFCYHHNHGRQDSALARVPSQAGLLSPGLSTPAAFWCLINDRRKYKINKKRFCPLMRCMQEGSGQNSRKWGLWRIAAAQDLIYSWYTPAFAATIRKRFYEWEYLYKRECNVEGR